MALQNADGTHYLVKTQDWNSPELQNKGVRLLSSQYRDRYIKTLHSNVDSVSIGNECNIDSIAL